MPHDNRRNVGSNDPAEVLAMHVVVQHRITDPEKFFSMNAEEIGGGGPPGVQVRQFFPFQDRSAAVCLWETDSIDKLRDYLDPATAGASENGYFEVDGERAMGLPATAAAGT
jgi:hypothetical protein